jgi:hypothetical protein
MARQYRNDHVHSTLVTYFPMLIAILSVLSSIYQGYLFAHSNDLIQRNVLRSEYLRTCREIIDTYFQVKLAVTQLSEPGANPTANATANANNLVGKFGALGTYLANFQDEEIRVRYTGLTHELARLVTTARDRSAGDAGKRFAEADRLFGQMNEDCVRLAQVVRM